MPSPQPFADRSTSHQPVAQLWAGCSRFLRERVFLLLILAFVVGTAGVLWHLYHRSADLYQVLAKQGAEAQAKLLQEFRELYTSEVVNRVKDRGIEITHDYDTPEMKAK